MSEKPIEQSKDFLKKYIWRLINFLIAGSALSSFVVFLLSHCDPTVLPAVVKLLDSLVASKLAIGFICSSSLLLFFVAIRNLLKPIIKPFCENYITQHEINAITKFIFFVLVGHITVKADRDDTTPLLTHGNGNDLDQDASDPKVDVTNLVRDDMNQLFEPEPMVDGTTEKDLIKSHVDGDDLDQDDLDQDTSDPKGAELAIEKSSDGDRDDDTTPLPTPGNGNDLDHNALDQDASNQKGAVLTTEESSDDRDGDMNQLFKPMANGDSNDSSYNDGTTFTVYKFGEDQTEDVSEVPIGFLHMLGLTGETSAGDHNATSGTSTGDNTYLDTLYDAVGGLFR